MPVQESVILNLENLNRIVEVNEEQGFATIEAGVTQIQLVEYLKQRNSEYFLDVTGSGQNTSIIGNILDRGVAYNSKRSDNLVHLNIITGKGNVIGTGVSLDSQSLAYNLNKAPIGPNFTGMMIQSSFGITVQGTISLIKRKKEKGI